MDVPLWDGPRNDVQSCVTAPFEIGFGVCRTCAWLYDQRGSELFEEITGLDEYYLTRTETAILRRHPGEMAALFGEDVVLLEYGAGAGVKSEILIDALKSPRM